jgi:hypothetical protein
MKKYLWIAVFSVALLAVMAFGFATPAYAQAPDPQNPDCPYCDGTGSGMMGRRARAQDGTGLLHDYMSAALAEAFGLTPAELQAAHDSGTTLWDIAVEQGKTVEEFQAIKDAARTSAITQAAAAGVISQEQADWMLERTQNGQRGAGMMTGGGCGGSGGRGPGNRGGGAGYNQP